MISSDAHLATQFLREGKLVAIPTETVYGLAGNAFDEQAVARIFKVKNRPSFDPLIVHTDSLEKVKTFVTEIPEEAALLARAFWPGPLTLLFPKNQRIPELVTSGLPHVAVRIPRHPLTTSVLEQLDFPLAAPSANPFGYVSPTNAQHVADQLGNKIAMILDGGNCMVGLESTIISFSQKTPVVLRKGGLAVEKIEELIGKVRVNDVSSSSPQAPGMLKSHYAPASAKVIIGDIPSLIEEYGHKKLAVLNFGKKVTHPKIDFSFSLSESGNTDEAAQKLFFLLRELDKLQPEIIVTEFLPETGLGRAVNDRLRRAAAL